MKRYNSINSRGLLFGIIIPILLFYISLNATYSYLSATAYTDKNSVDTSVIKVEFSEKSNNVDANTITASTKLIPGNTIELSGKVQNTGNEAIYAIITFEIETTKVGGTTTKTQQYYTLENGNLKEIISTAGKPSKYAFSLDPSITTEAFSVEYCFDFYTYNNTYTNANVKYSLSVNAIQAKHIDNNVVATRHLMGSLTLPDAYQEIEFIQSSGTQWINTGFTPNQDTRVVLDYQVVTPGANIIFGARTAFNNTSYLFNMSGSGGSPTLVTSYASEYHYTINSVTDTKRHIVDKNKNEVYFDGVKVHTFDKKPFTCPGEMDLFAGNSTTQGGHGYLPSKIKLYSCSIYDNDTLVRDFIPCYRKADNTIGLYDIVNNEFYENNGTGVFLKGESC